MEQYSPRGNTRMSLLNKLFMYLSNLPTSDRVLMKIAIFVLFLSLVWFAIELSSDTSVEVSTEGGELIEGIVGTPRFVNPVLAVTRADKDMSALVYAGLMKLGAEGTIVPDIAENIIVSEDGLTYNIILRTDVTFHDGTPVTAEDVVFTINRIQDPGLTSPLRANFEGVAVEQLGTYELNFVLREPYAPFVENLTAGIIPRHIWKDATNEEFPFSQHNSEPIGAGPYEIADIQRNTSGIPESYTLEVFDEYHGAVPNINTLTLNFYSNDEKAIEAFNAGEIHSISTLDPEKLASLTINEERHEVMSTPLPRTFAIFFNQNKSPALRDTSVRKALDAAIDREELINEVLLGYGEPLRGPIPPGFGVEATSTELTDATTTPLDAAREILREAGWRPNAETGIWEKEIDEIETPLAVSIATANSPVFGATAEYVRRVWEQLGVSVTIRQFEYSDLTQAIIRPREYEALLFGTVVGRPLDFYSFWHSSQRNDPGLNVALYANITTDSILTEARTNASSTERTTAFLRFAEEIMSETPAVFLYSPELTYVRPTFLSGLTLNGVAEPHERFSTVSNWSVETESVWPIFNQE